MFIGSAIILIFSLLRILWPFQNRKDLNEELLEKNAPKYEKQEKIGGILFMICLIIIPIAVFYFGIGIIEILKEHSSAIKSYHADAINWLYSSIFFGIGLAPYLIEWIFTISLRGEYKYYTEYTNRKHGWNGKKVMTPIIMIINIIGIYFFYQTTTVSINLNENNIEVQNFFEHSSNKYSYEEISKIEYHKWWINSKNNVILKDNYAVYATNGKELINSGDINNTVTIDSIGINIISKKADIPITFYLEKPE